MVKFILIESRTVVVLAGGRGNRSYYLLGIEFQSEKMKKFLIWIVVILQQYENTKCYLTIHLKMVNMVKCML